MHAGPLLRSDALVWLALTMPVVLPALVPTRLAAQQRGSADLRRVTFDTDPQWDQWNNRLLPPQLPLARQEFGLRASRFAGGDGTGEIGGRVQRSVTPAFVALPIEPRTLDHPLTASGTFAVTQADSGSGVLLGWFHHDSRGWRTPNSLALRVDGNGGKYWVLFEYGTRAGRTGGAGTFEGIYQTTKTKPFLADGTRHNWTLSYDPNALDGQGQVTLQLDEQTHHLPLEPGHRAEGADFDRFGIWNVQVPGEGLEIYVSNLSLDGQPLEVGPGAPWQGKNNQGWFPQRYLRPLHDFGFSASNHAGSATGEIGGVVWRATGGTYYGDRVGRLSLESRLHAEGRLVMTAASADSAACFGWFDSASRHRTTDQIDPPPGPNSLGILLEGLSRDGHYFRPAYATADGQFAAQRSGPVVQPDGVVHPWSLDYDPSGADGQGEITYRLDDQEQRFPLAPGHRQAGAHFDRFGLYGWERADGGFLELYLDDLRYTAGP